MTTEHAILAGGCFWGMQDLIRRYDGVLSTRVGYTGGDVENATYRNHGNHAEAIEIAFDPTKISYRELLNSSSRSMIHRQPTARAMTEAQATARPSTIPATRKNRLRWKPSPMSMPPVSGRERW